MRVMRFYPLYPQAWPLRTPFVIARGKSTEARVVVDIEQAGLHSIGECKPYPHYGETASVIGQINSVLHGIEQGISRDVLLQFFPGLRDALSVLPQSRYLGYPRRARDHR